MKTTKATRKITIEFTPGSNFQDRSAMEALRAMLVAWESFYLLQHQNNRFEIKGLENIEQDV